MSRPTLLTPELQNKICGYIENGNSYTSSFKLVGLSETQFYHWQKLGVEDIKNGKESIYAEFAKAIKKAREKCKAWHIQNINKAAEKQWQASAWYLERVFHKEFGRKDSLKVQGNFNVRNFDLELTDDEQAAYQERMKSVFGDDIQDLMGADIGEQSD